MLRICIVMRLCAIHTLYVRMHPNRAVPIRLYMACQALTMQCKDDPEARYQKAEGSGESPTFFFWPWKGRQGSCI